MTVGDEASATLPAHDVPRGRLRGWLILVAAMATLAYAANFSDPGDPPDDLLYRWSTAVAAIVQYAVILAVVLALSRGLDRAALGLQAPARWGRALGLVAVGYVAIIAVGSGLNVFLEAGEEQGLVPDAWDSSRAAPFIANFVAVACVAPVVEEVAFRGLGFAAVLSAWGTVPAVVVTALAFGLAHGLVIALPVLALFGVVLAVVRLRTVSVYPAMILHGIFNGVALLAAVTVGVS